MVRNPNKLTEYKQSRILRKKGFSYNEIKNKLLISKSTVSLWCRDIKLSEKQKNNFSLKKLSLPNAGAKANKERRKKEIEILKKEAKMEIEKVDFESFKIAGAMLYWAEGAKTKGISISNSDPRIIRFMMMWFKNIFDIKPTRIKAYVHLHDKNNEEKIKKFWSTLTKIPLKNFGKSFLKPKGTGHRTNIIPNGIIKIRVAGTGGENLRHRILAWCEKIYEIKNKIRTHSSVGRAARS